MSRLTAWLLTLVILCGSLVVWRVRRRVPAPESPSAVMLLSESRSAQRSLAVQGTQETLFFDAQGAPVETRAELLLAPPGRVRLRYLEEPLAGVTIWDDTDKSYRYDPNSKELCITASAATAGALQQADLDDNYRCTTAGIVQVARRPAIRLVLRPRQGSGPWRTCYLDQQHRLILATEDFEPSGKLLRSVRFTSVRFLDQDEAPRDSDFVPPEGWIRDYGRARRGETASRFSPSRLAHLVGFSIREPSFLPPGFRLTGGYPVPCGCPGHHQAARLEYSDGLQTVSLFECAHPLCATSDNCLSPQGDSLISAAHHYRRGGTPVSLLAVGSLPQSTLHAIARSVESERPIPRPFEPDL